MSNFIDILKFIKKNANYLFLHAYKNPQSHAAASDCSASKVKSFISQLLGMSASPQARMLTIRLRMLQSSEEAEMYTLPNGTVTTAEPRPSAYLPSVDHDLQLPRPYGSHAPFRPTESGSNMRHIRKPTVKPIEI